MSFSGKVKKELARKNLAAKCCRAAKLSAIKAMRATAADFGGLSNVRAADMKICCRRAFLRGAFLAAGSMSDPNKAYHLEIVCPTYDMARLIQELMSGFSTEPKITVRKKAHVVYLKEGSQIVDMLNVMGAHISLMELENVRILKEMRNTVNRKVNCETANIQKTVAAALKQTEDIIYLRDNVSLGSLPRALKEAALVRLANPDATLKELGEMLSPPVGKSGMNHRLRKLSEIAEKARKINERARLS